MICWTCSSLTAQSLTLWQEEEDCGYSLWVKNFFFKPTIHSDTHTHACTHACTHTHARTHSHACTYTNHHHQHQRQPNCCQDKFDIHSHGGTGKEMVIYCNSVQMVLCLFLWLVLVEAKQTQQHRPESPTITLTCK